MVRLVTITDQQVVTVEELHLFGLQRFDHGGVIQPPQGGGGQALFPLSRPPPTPGLALQEGATQGTDAAASQRLRLLWTPQCLLQVKQTSQFYYHYY